jgi:hypothetical protein
MLGVIGSYMFMESLGNLRTGKVTFSERDFGEEPWLAKFSHRLPFETGFSKFGIRMSVIILLIIGTTVWILAALMGISGGFIMAPVMLYLLRIPVVPTN